MELNCVSYLPPRMGFVPETTFVSSMTDRSSGQKKSRDVVGGLGSIDKASHSGYDGIAYYSCLRV
jgi:hypothetical protein